MRERKKKKTRSEHFKCVDFLSEFCFKPRNLFLTPQAQRQKGNCEW